MFGCRTNRLEELLRGSGRGRERLERRTELAQQCQEILDVAERRGLPRCAVTLAATAAAD
jgi:hypothetical protein